MASESTTQPGELPQAERESQSQSNSLRHFFPAARKRAGTLDLRNALTPYGILQIERQIDLKPVSTPCILNVATMMV